MNEEPAKSPDVTVTVHLEPNGRVVIVRTSWQALRGQRGTFTIRGSMS